MTNNDKNNADKSSNIIQMNLLSWCRWKALYYKDNKSLSASLQEESVYLKTLPNYKRKWIIDGIGSNYADINDSNIIKSALSWMIEDKGEKETLKIITSNCEDFKFFAEYCFNLKEN
jgi:hypothetical protein